MHCNQKQFDLMMEDYKTYESEFGVIPLLAGFDYLEQARRNSIKNLMQSNWRGLALSAVVVLTLFWLIIRRVRRRL